MSVSSSSTTQDSRSPSPLTPEASDSIEPVTVHGDQDLLPSWYHSMPSTKTPVSPWPSDPSIYTTPHKSEEENMLRLDDLIEQHAYDECVYILCTFVDPT